LSKQKSSQRIVDLTRAYQSVFSSDEGKLVLFDLMEKGYFLAPTFEKEMHGAERNEGKRELVLFILRQCNMNMSNVMELIKEEENNKETYHL